MKLRCAYVRNIEMNHEATGPIVFSFSLVDALAADQLTYVQMHRWMKVTGVKAEIYPAANVCGVTYRVNKLAFEDDEDGERRRNFNHVEGGEGTISSRPIYTLWTPDIDVQEGKAITDAYMQSNPKCKMWSPLRPIRMYRRINVPVFVKNVINKNVLIQRSGLLDTDDVYLTLGRLYVGRGAVDNNWRMEYKAHVRITYYVKLYGRRNI